MAGGLGAFFFGCWKFRRGSCLGCLNAIYGPDIIKLVILLTYRPKCRVVTVTVCYVDMTTIIFMKDIMLIIES